MRSWSEKPTVSAVLLLVVNNFVYCYITFHRKTFYKLTGLVTLDFITEWCFLTLHLKISVGFLQYATTNHSACIYESV
jgi:hypothetical protein